jgi:tetratricopeptide (TPR) repeat protein
MNFSKAVLTLCTLICLHIQPGYAAPTHTLKGVVMTPDGTVVPVFTVTIRPVVDTPQLLQRKQFKNGEFTLEGLSNAKYQIQVSAPLYVATRLELDFKAEPKPTDYVIVILHTFRNEARLKPGVVHTVSLKDLQRKVPDEAQDAYRKGVDLHREGRLDEALVEYGRALRGYPEYVEALSDLSTIFILYNRPDSALTFLRRAQDVDDLNPIINLNIAIALMDQRDYAGAVKLLQKVLKTDPKIALARYYLARIQYSQRKYAQAEEALLEAVQLQPTLLEAWLMLSRVSLIQKNYDQARDALLHIRQATRNVMLAKFIDEQVSTIGS